MATARILAVTLIAVAVLVVAEGVPFKRQSYYPGQRNPLVPETPFVCARFLEDTCQSLTDDPSRSLFATARFPNRRGQNVTEAKREFTHFTPLIASRCSSQIADFLCFFYFPLCPRDANGNMIRDYASGAITELLPCKEVCEEVRRDCEADLNQIGIEWPPHLNCSNDYFKSYNRDPRCVSRNSTKEEETGEESTEEEESTGEESEETPGTKRLHGQL